MAVEQRIDRLERIQNRAAMYRQQNPAFARWAAGYAVIEHSDDTQVRIYEMAEQLAMAGVVQSKDDVLGYLHAADRVASAAMWLVVHMTYSQRVYLDGRDLRADEFKEDPQGHMGGSLNMALAYTGYMAINAITGITRSWLMGQGHCVSAIDATNLILGNMTQAHANRYSWSDEGLTRFARDFYLRKVRPDGSPESPVGSHVNAHTAGGLMEGGYLGFGELYYVHMPLPGERLVAFLSDGAFEEQKGGDWAPRWWRADDSGLVAPILIANGRRIDQRTTMTMRGGVDWFRDYLALTGFEPLDIDGRDPAAYAWAIWEMEERLIAHAQAVRDEIERYPVALPYAIAEAPKGFGFPGAGTNAAHALPLGADLRTDTVARQKFNAGVRRLWVPAPEMDKALEVLRNHEQTHRPLERDHPLATRSVWLQQMPDPPWHDPQEHARTSPMLGVDAFFVEIVRQNPGLRARVGNPDEISSNRLHETLEHLKHRVTDPEEGTTEAVDGRIITALNEEAVVCAALANKGGINLVASYEAFAVKMLGAIRQELIFARHQREAGTPAGWLSVPVFATSHAWENAKNEMSHQDPTFSEALLAEMTDVSRVLFPADWNSAVATLKAVYQSQGQIWAVVAPKYPVPEIFTRDRAEQLIAEAGIVMRRQEGAQVLLAAIGAYQLFEAMKASDRLLDRGVAHNLVYLIEPGRFRWARDAAEAAVLWTPQERERFFPGQIRARVFITHTRVEPMAGALRTLDTGPEHARFLGFCNRGGTFDVFGMLFANRCTWGHVVVAAADTMGRDPDDLLTQAELAAVH
ncbi:MAG: xylulose 5-phosphate 3-epimerase, partial [Planctomycetes bacterium RBG_13_62_9]